MDNKRVNLYVDESLEKELRKINDNINKKVSEMFKIENVQVRGQVASKIAAMKLKEEKGAVPFKIKKTGNNKGYITIL